MKVPEEDIRSSIRRTNYKAERTSIQQKLKNPDVPDGKKARLGFRLRDLDNRLIPESTRGRN